MVATPANPGEALWIGAAEGKNHYNVGIGNTASGTAEHTDFSQSDIEGGYSQNPEFEMTADRLAVIFRINAGAGKTSANTKFPRTELREFLANGTTRAAWDGRTGSHYMKGRSRITAFSDGRPWICFFQIHDASSDLARVQTEGTAGQTTGLDLVCRRTPPGGSEIKTVIGSYSINTWINWEMRIDSGRLRVIIDSATVLDVTGMGNTGCYFKHGCYLQDNVADYGATSASYGQVETEAGSFVTWHTGYSNPTTPVFTGPDGGSVGDTQPPSVPTNLTAVHGDTQVALSWSGSVDDTGVASYNVYRDPGPPTAGVNSTFGKTTDGASSSTSSADKIAASVFTPSESGTLTAGHARVWLSAAGTSGTRIVVYADSAGAPGALLATSDETVVTAITEAVRDYTFSGANQISITSGTPYWLGLMWDDPGTPSVTFSRDATASGRLEVQGFTYPTPPDPFGTGTVQTGPIDVWAETTGASGPPAAGLQLIGTTSSTTYTDTGLTNGTEYSYAVSAEDAAANESSLSDAVSATPGPPDVTAPTVPTGLAAVPGDKRVALSWTASTDDTAVTAYLVYRDALWVASVLTTDFVDTDVTNGTQYSYTVSARDYAGNFSAESAPVLVTPAAPPLEGVEFLRNEYGEDIRLEVEVAWGADLGADPASWAWTDVTTHVRTDPGISTSLGRNDEASTSNPASLTLVLDNSGGHYSLGGRSPNWPYVRRNTPVRVRVDPADLVGPRTLFVGYADGFTPGWDSRSGRIPVVTLSASGVLRRLSQGDAPVQSVARRTYSESSTVVAYWPMEEGSDSRYAPALRGGSDFTIVGRPDWSAGDSFRCSARLPLMKDAQFNADISPYTIPDSRTMVRLLLLVPENTEPGTVLAHFSTNGSLIRWDVVYNLDNGSPQLQLYVYNSAGTALSPSYVLDFSRGRGQPLVLSLQLLQSGSDVNFTFGYSYLGENNEQSTWHFNVTLASHTFGRFTHIEINPHRTAGDVEFGHITVESTIYDILAASWLLYARAGEVPTGDGRLLRLCQESSVLLTVYGSVEGGDTLVGPNDQMGPQLVAPLLELLRECETADQGQLWDGRDAGLSYTTRRTRENGTNRLTIDADSGELAGAFDPVDDDQRNLNRAVVSRKGGITGRYEDTTGPLGTDAIGIYDSSLTVNNWNDSMAGQYAAWLVHLGTAQGYRYPSVTLNLHSATHLIPAALDIIPGSRIDVVNLDDTLDWFPDGTVSLIVEGIAHELAGKTWTVTFKCSPFSPWGVGRVFDEVGDTNELGLRADTDGAEVAAAAASDATSLSVATTTGPLWTTVADDFPLMLSVGGAPVRATACSGTTSPQTFTVDPLPYSRSAGAPVALWDGRPLGLG